MEVLVSPNPSVVNLLSINLKDGLLSSTALKWISNVIKEKGGNYLEDLTEQVRSDPFFYAKIIDIFNLNQYLLYDAIAS